MSGGTFGEDMEWNKKNHNDFGLRSGAGARKPDSIMSHQLLLPLKGCFLLMGTIASQMLVPKIKSGTEDLGQPCTEEKDCTAALGHWS